MPSKTYAAAETSSLNIGNGSGQAVSRLVVGITRTAGTVTPTARPTGTPMTAVNVPYTDRTAPSSLVAAGTAISAAAALIEVDATGVDVLLALSAFTGTIYWTPLEG